MRSAKCNNIVHRFVEQRSNCPTWTWVAVRMQSYEMLNQVQLGQNVALLQPEPVTSQRLPDSLQICCMRDPATSHFGAFSALYRLLRRAHPAKYPFPAGNGNPEVLYLSSPETPPATVKQCDVSCLWYLCDAVVLSLVKFSIWPQVALPSHGVQAKQRTTTYLLSK